MPARGFLWIKKLGINAFPIFDKGCGGIGFINNDGSWKSGKGVLEESRQVLSLSGDFYVTV